MDGGPDGWRHAMSKYDPPSIPCLMDRLRHAMAELRLVGGQIPD